MATNYVASAQLKSDVNYSSGTNIITCIHNPNHPITTLFNSYKTSLYFSGTVRVYVRNTASIAQSGTLSVKLGNASRTMGISVGANSNQWFTISFDGGTIGSTGITIACSNSDLKGLYLRFNSNAVLSSYFTMPDAGDPIASGILGKTGATFFLRGTGDMSTGSIIPAIDWEWYNASGTIGITGNTIKASNLNGMKGALQVMVT